ncbi:MAG: hypothetical protein NW217_11595 [Hyphomicrobiaceae bacterium]|nr:hypothetical protein [Hyphomicrobiaceae bacterium]
MDDDSNGPIERLIGRMRGYFSGVEKVAEDQASAADLIDAADVQLARLKRDLAAVLLDRSAAPH